MMNFYDIPGNVKSLFLTILFFILCVGCMCGFSRFQRKKYIQGTVVTAECLFLIALLAFYSANMFSAILDRKLPDISVKISKLPLFPILLILFGIIATEYVFLMDEYRYRKKSITHFSIQESLEHLDTGLCFFDQEGAVMLVNHRMLTLAFAITGQNIQNGIHFWEILQNGTVSDSVQCLAGGDTPEFLLPDGKIWTFRKETLESAIQLTATEITIFHQLVKQQREENANLEAMCRRIQSYGSKVAEYVIAKERLETRVNLHSFLGQALLTTRHYLQYESGDADKILKMWQRNIDVLQLEAEPQMELDTFSELKKNAQVVGIDVTIAGSIPKDPRIKKIFAAAGVETVINAGKHANAKNVLIEIEETNENYIACYTNDGTVPMEEIVEGGGLGSLRARVERVGGTMKISGTPKFVLTIVLEKEGKSYD